MLKWLFVKSRKVQRFFEGYFRRHEARLSAANLAAQHETARPAVEWVRDAERSGLRKFFTYHDRNCPAVRGISSAEWNYSHFRGRYPHHAESDAALDYTVADAGPDALDVRSADTPGTWIFLASREELPSVYALEFDYLPRTVFKEQLQVDFGAGSLAQRHRFILTYNRFIRYQRIECGFCLEDAGNHPFTLPLGRASRIRLEVVERTFTLLIEGRVVACWRDDRYRPRPARAYLLFWNGPDRQVMDFTLSNLSVFVRA